MSKRPILLLAVAAAMIAAVVLYVSARKPKGIVLTGIVTTDDVQVGALLQGRIENLAVAAGDKVEKGQLLARIAPQAPQADFAYYKNLEKAAAAAVEEAESQLTFFEDQTRSQIRQAQANVAVAQADARQTEADLANAQAEFKRQQQLSDKGLTSPQAVDAARAAYEGAKAHSESAVKQVQAAEAALSLAKANEKQLGAHKATVRAAGEQLAASRAQTEKAKIQLGYTEVRAPLAGIVDVRAALQGEVVNPGETIVSLIDPDNLWIRADVEESYIDRVHLGEKMQVRLPSGAARECSVFFRGVDADYATQRDVSRTKRDIKTFEIRLHCDNRDRSLALGMTAYVMLPVETP
ncbi:MAG TPA: efflux RND transporter periplasmic adaptor subunit [Gammaproteobacteria bacterium]|nr:efflux RND transporter periplasmic adaptor subunit [Gammaproteobacteria bacterium]